jgi:hypothetical protein
MLGGYNIFGSGAYATKTFTNLPPFFKVRVWFRFYKIDTWDSEVLRVHENSDLKHTTSSYDNKASIYTDNQCGGNDNEKSDSIALEFDLNTITSVSIKIDSNLNSLATIESWGFSDFAMSVLRCNPTCLTCTSETSTACQTCYTHATKQPDNSCQCDDNYYAVMSNPCESSPCTVCTSCYTGCRKCTGGGENECQSCVTGNIRYQYKY